MERTDRFGFESVDSEGIKGGEGCWCLFSSVVVVVVVVAVAVL
jgi:hypothetical protein